MFPKINWQRIHLCFLGTLIFPIFLHLGSNLSPWVGYLLWAISFGYAWISKIESINKSLFKLRVHIDCRRKQRLFLQNIEDRDLQICIVSLAIDSYEFKWKFGTTSEIIEVFGDKKLIWKTAYAYASEFIDTIFKNGYFTWDNYGTIPKVAIPISAIELIEISKAPTQEDLNVLRKITR